MKALLITEKCRPRGEQRDGGARVVDTLLEALGPSLTILQFGEGEKIKGSLQFSYPHNHNNRFIRRMRNASYIEEKIASHPENYTHLIFIHASMQFSLLFHSPNPDVTIWTFPMFLTPSYQASGEEVPSDYLEWERRALRFSHKIITPSHFEKNQLITQYRIPEAKITMIPRGIDRCHFPHRSRKIGNPLHFCSVGSIKPQKNTRELLKLFRRLMKTHSSAHLSLIGPIQNEAYEKSVRSSIHQLGLKEHVSLKGHVPPRELGKVLENCHLHLSTARCETFGRSIFETLSLGIPNVIFKENNASFDFLHSLPYIHFAHHVEEAIHHVGSLLEDYENLSSLAKEVSFFYDDTFLGNLLLAHLTEKEILIISDFDGTLWHKESEEKTKQCLEAFSTYSKKVICTARHPQDILERISPFEVQVDWIIGLSGAIVTDKNGTLLWTTPIENQTLNRAFRKLQTTSTRGNKILQLFGPEEEVPHVKGLRREIYEGKAYLQHWRASKLFAIHSLLRMIEWGGRVKVYGDGPYDQEMITYFDGTTISSNPESIIKTKEQLNETVLL